MQMQSFFHALCLDLSIDASASTIVSDHHRSHVRRNSRRQLMHRSRSEPRPRRLQRKASRDGRRYLGSRQDSSQQSSIGFDKVFDVVSPQSVQNAPQPVRRTSIEKKKNPEIKSRTSLDVGNAAQPTRQPSLKTDQLELHNEVSYNDFLVSLQDLYLSDDDDDADDKKERGMDTRSCSCSSSSSSASSVRSMPMMHSFGARRDNAL